MDVIGGVSLLITLGQTHGQAGSLTALAALCAS